ncbi:hypothetical protein B0H16DRAFT_880711 [Mycena metata]|uniref:Uncharacterized protein n=1 Tax=Mycena metata TaxID=1033252 RepID=A0AAD7NWQ4_9AGAR|nr:hypothetical protein B0H16DRAFT_880711 [Mycena metata]
MALISPTISSPTLSEANWHPSILAEYGFGPGYPLPVFQGLQSRWIHVACLANHHIPITSDDPPPQMLEVFVPDNDLQAALPLLPHPDHSAWDGFTHSPPSNDFLSSNFFSEKENYLRMRATDPVMMGEPVEQYLLRNYQSSSRSSLSYCARTASLGSRGFGTAFQRHNASSSPNPYLTSPTDTLLEDFDLTPDESPFTDFSLATPVLKDDELQGHYDDLALFGGVLESSGEAAPFQKPTTSVFPTSREMSDDSDDSVFPLVPSVVVTPVPSSRVPAPGPRHTPNSPDSPVSGALAFDARPDVFDDPWSASPLIPSIILSPPASSAMSESVSPPPRSRQGREARSLKHSIDDTLDPSISKNNKRRRIGP